MKSDAMIDKDTWDILCRLMTPENDLIIRVALATGLRVGDVVKIKGKDIHGTTLTYVAEKTGKEGTKRLLPELAECLKRQCHGDDERYCFPHRDYPKERHRCRQTVWANLRMACRQLGIKANVTPHSARKAYAIELEHEAGEKAVQRELQHSNIETTRVYTRARGEENAIELRGAFIEELTEEVGKAVYKAVLAAFKDIGKVDLTL